MKRNLFGVLGIALAAVLVSAVPVHAVLVNVDFNFNGSDTYTGSGAAGGGTWNGVNVNGAGTSASGSALLDSTGGSTVTLASPTGVSVSVTGIGDPNVAGNDVDAGGTLLDDYLQVYGASPKPITITGLTPGGSYDLWLYAAIGNLNLGYNTKFTFGGIDKTSSDSGYTFTATSVPGSDEGKSFVKYAELIADGLGSIAGTVVFNNLNGGDLGIFNGLQIANSIPTPEPSSILLTSLGLMGCARLRRFKNFAK